MTGQETQKAKLIEMCTKGSKTMRKEAVSQLMAFECEEVVETLKTISRSDKCDLVRKTALGILSYFDEKHQDKNTLHHNTKPKKPKRLPNIKKIFPKERMKQIISNVHYQLKLQNIPYNNETAFNTFTEMLKKIYPNECEIFLGKFSHEKFGMKNYFERMPEYCQLFISKNEMTPREKVFSVFDAEHVGYRTVKLKQTQLKHCGRTLLKLYPEAWETASKDSPQKTCPAWIQAQYIAYKAAHKQSSNKSNPTVKSTTPPTN